ncbi:enoyl-CoA hydratase/isomerase family protein [Pseudovibrio sp. SPO723]|uniref:enoyl-CoA hydratase/isomerase family protein n=1 Tax=Nesiotobacter zosterae TaxID=392721 RepID=UPI0029C4E48C|nr:enoyl-CoA hydratase/isomerase family protein [Pseudovibrio sp. SPO723]MDX5592505.1 enoyl-CoA hydratase/isomerase family protein [Pseudovibrio sp. SPO723]
MTMTDEVLFERKGHAGLMVLNRAKALNALTHEMVVAMHNHLTEWDADPSVRHIIIKSNSDRAFCAGGDIRQVAKAGPEKAAETVQFFADEYRLNAAMKACKTPLVALIDGIVMGGGVGISVHGHYRVGSEKTLFAMPETGIGFFPDVGGGYFLPRLPHALGYYCALTAERLNQADCCWAGILTHAVPAEKFEALEAALCAADNVESVLDEYGVEAGHAPISDKAQVIESCFGVDTTAGIFEALSQLEASSDDDFARKTLDTLGGRSPTSIEVAFRQLKRGAELSMNDCMIMEYRIVSQILQGHDFYEGVRAVLIDKDHSPKWRPERMSELNEVEIEAHFMPPKGGDLTL